MIGTDVQAAGPQTWPGSSSEAEIFGRIMEAWAEDDGFSGVVLAAHSGRVVFRGAYGVAELGTSRRIALDTPFRIGFMSAYFTAVTTGLLADDGALDLDDPIGRFVTGLRPDIASTSVRHLLAGRDGLDRDFWRHTAYEFSDRVPRGELVGLVNRLERLAEPGERYAGPGPDGAQPHYLLLGLAIEGAAGRPFEEVVTARVLRPLGLSATGFLTLGRPAGLVGSHHRLFGILETYSEPHPSHLFSSGAMYATVGDLYAFFHAVVDERAFGETAVEAFKLRSFDTEFAVVDGSLVTGDDIPSGARRLHTGGSNGWMRGETILYQHIFETGDVVIALSNVHRAAQIYDIRRRFARLRFGLPVGAPLPKTGPRLWDLLRDEGVDAAATFYDQTLLSGVGAGDLPWPDQFMHHARELRWQGRFEEALLATELYVRTQPDFYLPYREMGEIHRARGDTERAVLYFRKALARNPDDPVWKRDMEVFVTAHAGDGGGRPATTSGSESEGAVDPLDLVDREDGGGDQVGVPRVR